MKCAGGSYPSMRMRWLGSGWSGSGLGSGLRVRARARVSEAGTHHGAERGGGGVAALRLVAECGERQHDLAVHLGLGLGLGTSPST
eukprot:scaffold35925_cov28-Phaeocystis_antarctica.AAC.1